MGDIRSATLSQGANGLTSKMQSDRCAVGCFIVSIMFLSQERHIGRAEIAWHLQAQAHVSASILFGKLPELEAWMCALLHVLFNPLKGNDAFSRIKHGCECTRLH